MNNTKSPKSVLLIFKNTSTNINDSQNLIQTTVLNQ